MGKITEFSADELDLGTGSVLVALQTAAAGSAASNIRVKRVEVFQNGTTTLEMCRIEFATRNTAGTLTTTSAAPVTISPLGGAASGLSGNTSVIGGAGRSGYNSSADSGGTYTTHHFANFANINGYIWKPDPEEEIWIPPSTVWVVRFTAAPSGNTDWGFNVVLNEN